MHVKSRLLSARNSPRRIVRELSVYDLAFVGRSAIRRNRNPYRSPDRFTVANVTRILLYVHYNRRRRRSLLRPPECRQPWDNTSRLVSSYDARALSSGISSDRWHAISKYGPSLNAGLITEREYARTPHARACILYLACARAFTYASRLRVELSVCGVDDSGYWDAVCKPRLPAFSWLTHANRDSLRIWSTMKIALAGKTDYLKIIDFRPALRSRRETSRMKRGRDKTENFRFLVWTRVSLRALGYTTLSSL